MVQINLEIDDITAEAIRTMAAKSNKSDVDVVREALQVYIQNNERKLPTGAGKYHSGDGTIGSRTREILRKAVEDGEWP